MKYKKLTYLLSKHREVIKEYFLLTGSGFQTLGSTPIPGRGKQNSLGFGWFHMPIT